MDRGPADRHHIVERALECGLPVAFAPGHRGKTEFGAERRVDAKLDQSMPLKLGLHRRRRNVIRKLQLDRREAGGGSGAEALDQRTLGEQITEIGGKAGHGIRPYHP